MTTITDTTGVYTEQFSECAQTLERLPPAWLQSIREAALAKFVEQGFPTTRDEEWRHTSVAPLARTEFAVADRWIRSTGSASAGTTKRCLSSSTDVSLSTSLMSRRCPEAFES